MSVECKEPSCGTCVYASPLSEEAIRRVVINPESWVPTHICDRFKIYVSIKHKPVYYQAMNNSDSDPSNFVSYCYSDWISEMMKENNPNILLQ